MKEQHLTEQQVQDFAMSSSKNLGKLSDHLASCDACKLQVLEYRMLYQELSSQDTHKLDTNLKDTIMAQIQASETELLSPSENKRFIISTWVLAIAIILSSLLIIQLSFVDLVKLFSSFASLVVLAGAFAFLLIAFSGTIRTYQEKFKLIENNRSTATF